MSILLIYKILVPFAIVSAVFTTLHAALGLPPFSLFLTALTLSDVLTLNFFFLVRDEGSWLDIGQSISHFCIASGLLVFGFVLHLGGERLMRVR
jgi:phosphatidylinositol glycan class N